MKKFLSLVLALVMTMSLVTVSAGAKDFTDDSKINYDEAVAVMSTLGVVGGYADGSFNPSATLTRGAAAKIICNVILGTTTANALVAKTAPYKDVPANHTFAGYIAYCQKEGIISGYADGTFKPANTLTGYAFMKMLLGALGLDAEVEGYTGPNWSISVAKRALSDSVDLANGLKGDFNGVKAVTREEACLYAFNMIQAKKFTYDNSSTIVVGNITVKNNSKATQDGNSVYYKVVFTKLKALEEDVTDHFGRPATTWKYDNKEIGTYAKTADATYTAAVKEKDLWKDLDIGKGTSLDFKYYEDGKYSTISLDKDSKDKLGGNGVVLEAFYDTDKDGKVTTSTIVEINTYFGQVDDVDKNDNKERIVTVDGIDYVTNEFEEDDKVIYTKGLDGKDGVIMSMAKAEKKTGEYTKLSGDDVTISGTKYTLNAEGKKLASVKDDVDFYLDANGYIIYMETSDEEANVDNLAYVVEAGKSAGDYYAILRLADGSKKKVDADTDYTTVANEYVNHIVTFKDTKNGVKLTDKATYEKNEYVYTNEKALFKKGKPTFDMTTSKDFKTDSKTVFVYATTNKGDTEYKSYTGYKNAPSIGSNDKAAETTVVSAYLKDGVAVMVYVAMPKASVGTSSADMTFVAYDKGADWTNEGDDVAYYELNAVVDGKITTVKVNADVYKTIASANDGAGKDELVAAYDGLTYNSDNIATSTTPATDTVKGDFTVKALKNDMIQIGTDAYAFTDDAKVFFVDGCDFTEGKTSSIRDDNNGTKNPYKQVVFHTDDGDIDIIFLVKK